MELFRTLSSLAKSCILKVGLNGEKKISWMGNGEECGFESDYPKQ